MHIEADRCEDEMERWGVEPWHLGQGDASDPGERGAEVQGRFVALRLPMGGRRGG